MNDVILDRLDAMQAWVHRRRWWLRLAIAVLVVPPLWSFVSSRWNARPPRQLSPTVSALGIEFGVTRPPPDVDNTPAVAEALAAMPREPALAAPTSAPEGSRWAATDTGMPYFDVTEALAGRWEPHRRHHLREIIRYLELPAMQAALDSLATEAGRPHCLTSASGLGSPLATIRQASKLLAVRARRRLAEGGDLAAAVRDIEAILHLSDSMINNGTLIRYLVAIACRSLALQELSHWPAEFSLSAERLERLAGLLKEHPFDARSAWRQAMRGEVQCCEALLDTMFVTTPDGDGFLVLPHEQTGTERPWVLGALSLTSPVFESRCTADGLMVLSDERVARLAELTVSELTHVAASPGRTSCRPVLGPAWTSLGLSVGGVETWVPQSLIMGIRVEMESDLCTTAMALRRYWIDEGHYPASLSLLVPAYTPQIPADLANGQALRYQLTERGDYLLYSVGQDLQDDSGRRFDGRADTPFDWVLNRQRDEPTCEWFLVTEDDSGGFPDEHGTD